MAHRSLQGPGPRLPEIQHDSVEGHQDEKGHVVFPIDAGMQNGIAGILGIVVDRDRGAGRELLRLGSGATGLPEMLDRAIALQVSLILLVAYLIGVNKLRSVALTILIGVADDGAGNNLACRDCMAVSFSLLEEVV